MGTTWAARAVAVATSAVLALGLLTAPANAESTSSQVRDRAVTAASTAPDVFRFYGSGFGHGVGMPQYGAYEMTRRGYSGVEVLKHYYQGARAPWLSTPENVSVQVHGPDPYNFSGYGDTRATTSATVHHGAWRLRARNGDTLATGKAGARLVVTTSGGKASVTVGGRTWTRKVLRLHWAGTRFYRPNGADAVVSVQGAHGTYRHGRLTFQARQGIPNVVNDLRLNTEYLYGIAEMPSSWGLSGGKKALRAQAMAARSYALLKTESRQSSCGCHLVDDVRDQHFTGWDKESEGPGAVYGTVWKAAVDASVRNLTRARVLAYQGEPVAAHYYSSSGGRTANSEDVWSSVVPYERSVADPYSKAAPGNSKKSWYRRMTQNHAQQLFGTPNDIMSIAVTSRYASGQMRTLTANLRGGGTAQISGKADALRSRIGQHTRGKNLPAAWINRVVVQK